MKIYYLKIMMMIIIITMSFMSSATSSIEGIVLSKSSFQFWNDMPQITNFTLSDCISETHDCDFIKYFFQLQQLYDKIFHRTFKQFNSTKQTRIDVISNENAYSNSFGKYIMKSRPFKGIFSSNSISKVLLTKLNQAFISYSKNSTEVSSTQLMSLVELRNILSFDNSILDISEFLDKVVIPKYATNNYLRRIKPPSCQLNNEENEVANSSNNTTTIDCQISHHHEYSTKWPSIRFMSLNHPSSAYKCPANMHNLIWTYATEAIKVQVRLFPVESSMSYFTLSDSFNESIIHMNNSVRQRQQPIHYNEFIQDGFSHHLDKRDPGNSNTNPLPAFSETTLTHHHSITATTNVGGDSSEYLFVPNSFISSILCTVDSVDTTEEEVTCPIVNLCFVDASNLNIFRDAMSIHGNIFIKEHELLQELSPLRMDFTMWKDPYDLSWNDYVDNNHNNKHVDPIPTSPVEAAATVQSEHTSTSTASNTEGKSTGRDRRKRIGKKSEFRDWQDLNKWNAMVNSLILPVPSIPKIVNIGRDNVTISWHSAFIPSTLDVVNFGFKVIYCINNDSIYRLEEFLLPSTSFLVPEIGTTCGVSIFSRALGNLKEQIDLEVLKYSGYETVVFTANVLNLCPNTEYQLRLILFYDQAESTPSLFSLPFKTEITTVPSMPLPYSNSLFTGSTIRFSVETSSMLPNMIPHGVLEFQWPIDDGGYPILGFHVYCRHHHLYKVSSSSSDWDWLGLFPATIQHSNSIGIIEIYNLLPNTVRLYQFKISAYNKLGNSHYSVFSNIERFTLSNNDGTVYTLYGQGHKNYKGPLTKDYLIALKSISAAATASIVSNQVNNKHDSDVILACRHGMLQIESVDEVLIWKPCNTKDVREGVDVISLRSNIWRSHWTSPYLSIVAEFVIAKPIYLDSAIQTIEDDDNSSNNTKGKIVLCLRGIVPFTEKALRAQEAGAVALIVIDNSRCESYDQKCLFGANKHNKEGFGQLDIKSHWEDIEIPVYFILGHYLYDIFENINTNIANYIDANNIDVLKNLTLGYHSNDEL